MITLRSHQITDKDGDYIQVAETRTPDCVIVRVSQADAAAAVGLSREQFEALCGLKYELRYTPAPVPEPPKPAEALTGGAGEQ